MINAIVQFRRNRDRTLELGSIYNLLEAHYPLLVAQREEVLRAQIVLIVSAFDTFIHDCIRTGIINIFSGSRNAGNTLSSYAIPFDQVQSLDKMPSIQDKINHLDNILREKNSKDSYQSPKSIEYALGLINVDKVWTRLSPFMNKSAADIRNQLALIVDRRNKIAHESDYNPFNRQNYPITKQDVDDVINYMNLLVIGIYKIV